jgi:hypothetical protein
VTARTDQVILYLTSMWQALTTTTLTGLQVADGPQVNVDPSNDWLFVGFNGGSADEFNEGATAQQSRMAFTRVKAEDGQVTCAVVSVTGDSNIAATRARAYGFLSAAEDAVRTDPQLGGLVMDSFVSDHRYSPVQTSQGAKVRIVFTVTYKGQI